MIFKMANEWLNASAGSLQIPEISSTPSPTPPDFQPINNIPNAALYEWCYNICREKLRTDGCVCYSTLLSDLLQAKRIYVNINRIKLLSNNWQLRGKSVKDLIHIIHMDLLKLSQHIDSILKSNLSPCYKAGYILLFT